MRKERLSRYRQIKISVVGRKSGKTISIPVWFAPETALHEISIQQMPIPLQHCSSLNPLRPTFEQADASRILGIGWWWPD